MGTVLHAVAGYLFLLLIVRVLARRPGAQMTPFEFVLIFLMGGVIILATVGDDHSLTNCFAAVVAICFMHRMLGAAKMRSKRLGMLIDGTPIVLLKNDNWQKRSMTQTRVADMDVMAAARTKGIKSLDQIKFAVLERNGAISIIRKKQEEESR